MIPPEVVVVGGGPAGLAFAIRAVERGLRVLVLDRARPPIDKPCGEGLMPDGVACLTELGALPEPAEVRPFSGIRYVDGERVAEGRFPGSPGWGVRRTVLHRALVRRAEAAGVELRWGVVAEGLDAGRSGSRWTVRTSRGPLLARWIVGADGLRSRIRRWAGLERSPGEWRRFGVRRHFRIDPWTDRVEVHWARGCEAYVTPVDPESVGVAILWGPSRGGAKAGFDRLLTEFPTLGQRLHDAPTTGRDRGTGPFHQRVRAVHHGPVALLGDAAGYLDPITGEGLSIAFHQAFALVDAIEIGDLRGYGAAVRRLRRLPDLLTRLLLFVEKRPWLRRRMIETFARDPAIFSLLVGIHARQRPPASLGLSGAMRLGWGLISSAGPASRPVSVSRRR